MKQALGWLLLALWFGAMMLGSLYLWRIFIQWNAGC